MHMGKLMAPKLEYTHTHTHTQTYFHLLRIVCFSLPPVCGVNDLGDKSLQLLVLPVHIGNKLNEWGIVKIYM